MNTPNRRFALTALALIATVEGGMLLAGPLNPPAGPVMGTYKTLTEVEPRTAINATNTPGDANSLFKITQPGSYYLTGNITGVVGKHGIEIVASGVTLDLKGFDLSGVPGSLDGVSLTVQGSNITILNGSVRNWGDRGIDMQTFGADGCRVADVIARSNGNMGIAMGGGSGSVIANCAANRNGGNGIYAGNTCSILNCAVSSNSGHGVDAGPTCSILNCVSTGNAGNGINADAGSTVSNCSAFVNNGYGINAFNGSIVSGCTALSNSIGGIKLFGTGGMVVDCAATTNSFDGIECGIACVIRGNTCQGNGAAGDGAGIHTTGAGNRIEGNNCIGADRGIGVDFRNNIIINNTCSGNTIDWVIVANNVVGPILDRRAPASAAVSGFSAPDSTGSNHLNANFSY